MRRLSVLLGLFTAFAVPAAALAAYSATGDGSLVVKNGSAPQGTAGTPGTPVVLLHITGSVIGQVGPSGRLVIDAGPNADATAEPQVTGAGLPTDSSKSKSSTAQVWNGNGVTNFRFRAVGGTYTVLVYGSGVNLVAVGVGTVRLAGLPDTPSGDGRYSLNGADFASLPGTQTDKRSIGPNG
jgi:hypothetical protein